MRKKIIFYIGSMQRGGAQRVMTNLLTHYLDAGNDVVLVNDIVPSVVIPEYPIDSRVRKLYLGSPDDNILKKNIKRVFRLRAIIRKEKPEVVVSFMGPPNIRLIFASIGCSTKIVVSVRNDPNEEYGRGIKRFLANMLFLRADGIVFQTDDARKYFSEKNQQKSRVIFNPVNSVFFDTSWNPSKKEIVVVGRLEKQKNPFLAVDAFLTIAEDFPDYKLVFYGEGSLKKDLATYIAKRNAVNRIELRGATDDVAKVLSESALYMMTSDFEGMPNALMEAMAVGIPAISTDCPCGGPRLVSMDGNAGILLGCGDVDGFAKAIKKILPNRELQKNVSYAEQERSVAFKDNTIFEEWDNYLGALFSKNVMEADDALMV